MAKEILVVSWKAVLCLFSGILLLISINSQAAITESLNSISGCPFWVAQARGEGLLDGKDLDAHSEAVRRFEEAFKEKHPGLVSGNLIIKGYDGLPLKTTSGKKVDLRLEYPSAVENRLLSEFSIRVEGKTMGFDIFITEGFRDLKLYSYLLAVALAKYPRVKHIPSAMAATRSFNARKFFEEVITRDLVWGRMRTKTDPQLTKNGWPKTTDKWWNLGEEIGRKRSKKDWADLHRAILGVFRDLPSTKARAKLGFSKIEKIVINPATMEFSFVISKGENRSDSDIVIAIVRPETDRFFRLYRNGEVKEIDSSIEEIKDFGTMDDWALG